MDLRNLGIMNFIQQAKMNESIDDHCQDDTRTAIQCQDTLVVVKFSSTTPSQEGAPFESFLLKGVARL